MRPHSDFRKEVYEWYLVMTLNKWYLIKPKTLTMEESVNALKYLIDCGEPLVFNDAFTMIKKEKSYRQILESFR